MKTFVALIAFVVLAFAVIVWPGPGGNYVLIRQNGQINTQGIDPVIFPQDIHFNGIFQKQSGASYIRIDVDPTLGPIIDTQCDGLPCPATIEAKGSQSIVFRTGNVNRATINTNGQLTIPVKASINLEDPTTGDSGFLHIEWPNNITLTEIACSTDTGTTSINFAERTRATPNTGGTNTLSTALVCDNDYQVTTSFADATIAADVPHALLITAVSGAPNVVRIFLKGLRNL